MGLLCNVFTLSLFMVLKSQKMEEGIISVCVVHLRPVENKEQPCPPTEILNSFSPMAGKSPGPFPNCDWRFNEFPNPAAHALHVTCVELMALAVPGKDVGNALLNVALKRFERVALS